MAAVSLLCEKQKIQKQQHFTAQILEIHIHVPLHLFTNNVNVQEMCEECMPLLPW